MARQIGQQGQQETTFGAAELKLCELCGWLNLDSNEECFVCGWHGHFEHRAEFVRAAAELASLRHGRLELQHLTDVRTYRKPAPPTLKSRLRTVLRRAWNWLRG